MEETFFIPRIIKRLHILGDSFCVLDGTLLDRVAYILSVDKTVAREMIESCGFDPNYRESERQEKTVSNERQLTLF